MSSALPVKVVSAVAVGLGVCGLVAELIWFATGHLSFKDAPVHAVLVLSAVALVPAGFCICGVNAFRSQTEASIRDLLTLYCFVAWLFGRAPAEALTAPLGSFIGDLGRESLAFLVSAVFAIVVYCWASRLLLRSAGLPYPPIGRSLTRLPLLGLSLLAVAAVGCLMGEVSVHEPSRGLLAILLSVLIYKVYRWGMLTFAQGDNGETEE
jgi:hypothetical protein